MAKIVINNNSETRVIFIIDRLLMDIDKLLIMNLVILYIKNMNFIKTYFLTLLLVSQISFSAEIILQEDIDDFDDERELTLAFMEDSHNSIISRMVAIYCSSGRLALGIDNGIFFTLEDYVNVKIRFDKKETLEESLIHNGGLVASIDKRFIRWFIDEALTSNDMVLKVEDNDHIMRFSNFSKDQEKVAQFKEKIQSIKGCEL